MDGGDDNDGVDDDMNGEAARISSGGEDES